MTGTRRCPLGWRLACRATCLACRWWLVRNSRGICRSSCVRPTCECHARVPGCTVGLLGQRARCGLWPPRLWLADAGIAVEPTESSSRTDCDSITSVLSGLTLGPRGSSAVHWAGQGPPSLITLRLFDQNLINAYASLTDKYFAGKVPSSYPVGTLFPIPFLLSH